MKNNRLLPPVLVIMLLLVTACNVHWPGDLPVISQWLAPSPTPSPLPTATLTPVPTATPIATIPPPPTDTPSPTPTPTLPPAPPPPTGVLEIARGDVSRPWIALTFDAGASIAPWPSILETLRQKDVRCTFFVTGIILRQAGGPELMQQLVAEGHELGNHSDTHPQFTTLTDEQIGEELAAVEDEVVRLTGRTTKPYFRPPFGNRDERVWRVVQENGYLTIYWTYHVYDCFEDTTAEKVYSSAIEGACNGAIVLMHVGAWETADMLPAIIDDLRARGYRLVTLSELLSP